MNNELLVNILKSLLILLIFFAIIRSRYLHLYLRPDTLVGKITRSESEKDDPKISLSEIYHLFVAPVIGYFILSGMDMEAEFIDDRYMFSVISYTMVPIFFYFLSRTMKREIGPLGLAIIPGALLTGLIMMVVQLVQFGPVLIMSILIFPLMYVFPAFSLFWGIAYFSAELYAVLKFNKRRLSRKQFHIHILFLLHRLYTGENRVIGFILSFPFFVVILQFILLLFDQKPDDLIKGFTESSDGIFSRGERNHYPQYTPEYICTIAAFGTPALVKPLYSGMRNGQIIKVNRQLQVCNAFEELLSERFPLVQKYLRKKYDGLQISIEKWKSVTLVSNLLYLLIKPMEWIFLLTIYFVDPEPERRIYRQYMDVKLNPESKKV